MRSIPEWRVTLWRFVYGTIDLSEFENWAYEAENLESLLSSDLYLKLLETNYQDHLQISELQLALLAWLEPSYPQPCFCIEWNNYEVALLGDEKNFDLWMERFEVLKRRTPWIDLVCCKGCAQIWYLAVDTKEYLCHFQRLTAEDVKRIAKGYWPSTFDDLEAVWPSQEWLRQNGFNSLSEWQDKEKA